MMFHVALLLKPSASFRSLSLLLLGRGMASARAPVITDQGSVRATWSLLCKTFKMDPKIGEKLKAVGCETVEDFRFLFSQEADVNGWMVDVDLDASAKGVQSSRLRQAWHSVRRAATLRESQRQAPEIGDLDEMLDDDTLRSAKDIFWSRHKLDFPAEVYPADTLISRCSRELARRACGPCAIR